MKVLRLLLHLPTLFKVAVAAILAVIVYWGLIASDRFVSEAVVVVDRTELGNSSGGGGGLDIASFLGGGGGGGSSVRDLMLLQNHMLSVDMLQKLDKKLDLRSHFSDTRRDPLSRMWFKDASQEFFHEHFLSRVTIRFDMIEGVMHIRAEGYTAEMAHKIARGLVEEGERFMNEMAHRLASEQVDFLERQVSKLSERVMRTRNALVNFQNAKGLISPQATTDYLSSMVGRLEGQISELKARRDAMLGYLSPTAHDVVALGLQIDALEKQLRVESQKMTSPSGATLNRAVEEYQRLQMEADFARDLYRSALTALERGRVESTRTLKKISILQSPSLPQYPLEPRRLYNITVTAITVIVLAGIAQMLAAIIRDHKD